MEPIRHNPQGANPNRPGQPGAPRPRPILSDFGGMSTARPASLSPQPQKPIGLRPAHPGLRPMTPGLAPKPHASAAAGYRPTPIAPHPAAASPTDNKAVVESRKNKPAEPREKRSKAWLVGLVVFVLLGGFAMSPLVPGKILENFPGSSQSFSTGDQDLACATDLTQVHTTQKYNTKLGFPLVYSYSTTTTQTAVCNGKSQSAIGGHTSQFNPLGAAINLAAALAIALAIGKVWGWLRRDKR